MRILVIEDDEWDRNSLASLLEFSDYHVTCCEDGQSAIKALEDADHDLIFLDLSLPVMNGFEFREWQLSDERFAKIPVIAVSGAHWKDEWKQDLKAAAFLTKPIAMMDLDQCLAACEPSNRFNAPTFYDKPALKKGGTR